MNKRKDECFKCSRRKCYYRIYRHNGPHFDEIACYEHINDLEKYADETLGTGNGVSRSHISSTCHHCRGDKVSDEILDQQEESESK